MPVERQAISVNQFCELLALDPQRFIAVERNRRDSTGLYLVMEPEMQTTGTCPEIHDNKTRGPKKGGKKR